jgi:hypothetical protein
MDQKSHRIVPHEEMAETVSFIARREFIEPEVSAAMDVLEAISFFQAPSGRTDPIFP